MFILNFGKWSSGHGKMFSYYRVYYNKCKWTPIVEVERRYNRENESVLSDERENEAIVEFAKCFDVKKMKGL